MNTEKEHHPSSTPDDSIAFEPMKQSVTESDHARLLSIDDHERLANEKLIAALKQNPDLEQETAHVLFMDVVGFSLITNEQQTGTLARLQEIVRNIIREYVPHLKRNQLILLPTGDGMALVFLTKSPVAPVKFAQQIYSALRAGEPKIALRMGVHSGPVYRFKDINRKSNVVGDGINIAQRIMDCGDDGHILLSNEVAAFLISSEEWKSRIHDLGIVKVKHNATVHVFNYYDEKVGKSRIPAKISFQCQRKRIRIAAFAMAILAITIAVVFSIYYFVYPIIRPRTLDSLLVANIDSSADDGINEKPLSNSIFRTIAFELNAGADDLRIEPQDDAVINFSNLEKAREYAQKHDFQGILYGTIQQLGGTYSVAVNLIDIRTGVFLLKNQLYSKRESEIQEMPVVITYDVMRRLRGKSLSIPSPTNSSKAFLLYSEGRHLLEKRTKNDIHNSIEKFSAALQEDPQYAEVYAALAEVYDVIGGYTEMAPREAYQKAEFYARKAIALDSKLLEAHVALAYCKANYDWDWKTAGEEYQTARAINSTSATFNYSYAFNYLIPQGHMNEAINVMTRANETAYEQPIINTNLGWTYYYAGDIPAAINQYKSVLKTNPEFPKAHKRLIEAYEQSGAFDEVIKEWHEWANLPSNAENKVAWLKLASALDDAYRKTRSPKDYWQTLLNFMLGKDEPPPELFAAYDIAGVYSMLGKNRVALGYLQKAFDNKDDGIIKLAVNPRFQSLHSDPTFISYVDRVGLKFPR